MEGILDVIFVAVGGAAGAATRYLVERTVSQRIHAPFPYGVLIANVVGSFILGVLLGTGTGVWLVLVGVGFCGALTTYSTFAADTVRLAAGGRVPVAVANIVVSMTAGLGAVGAGLAVGALLSG
jgi:CrcB protein